MPAQTSADRDGANVGPFASSERCSALSGGGVAEADFSQTAHRRMPDVASSEGTSKHPAVKQSQLKGRGARLPNGAAQPTPQLGQVGDGSGEGGELQHLLHNLPAGGDLPRKQQDVDRVERNVRAAGGVVALLHGGHQRGCQRPQHGDGCTRIQMGPREQLACR
ncbi:hypothetical protein ACK3TF_004550 [Chlorella vulgaris]